MTNDKKGNASSFEDLLGEIEDELEAEQVASMSSADRALADIARRMLRLERDMTIPGSATSAAARVERLSKFIEEEDF